MKAVSALLAVAGAAANDVTQTSDKWWLDSSANNHDHKNWGTGAMDETIAHFTFDGGDAISDTIGKGADDSVYFTSDPTDLDFTGGLAFRDDAVGYKAGDKNFLNTKTAFIGDVNQDIVKWNKVGGTKGISYRWDLYVIGSCKMQRRTTGVWKGNMAWHVTNTAERTATAAGKWEQDSGNCEIATRELLRIPQIYDRCRFSLRVQDMDFHGASKDKEDYMCLHPLNAHGNLLTDIDGNAKPTCQRDDIGLRRRLLQQGSMPKGSKWDTTHFSNQQEMMSDPEATVGKQFRRSTDYYTAGQAAGEKLKLDPNGMEIQDTVKHVSDDHAGSWYEEHLRGEKDDSETLGGGKTGYGDAPAAGQALAPTSDHGAIITTQYYDMKELNSGKWGANYGIKLKITAKADHNWEHWYADDLKILCTITLSPTPAPTPAPTPVPTTFFPTAYPTPYPTAYPTSQPTTYPTPYPTTYPTPYPTPYPTAYPSPYPTPYPTAYPSSQPTTYPTPYPTAYPTSQPTTYPTPYPTTYPTPYPTTYPTPYPTTYPTTFPTPAPTQYPTSNPTKKIGHFDECEKTYCTYKVGADGHGHTLIRGFTRVGERFHCERNDGHIHYSKTFNGAGPSILNGHKYTTTLIKQGDHCNGNPHSNDLNDHVEYVMLTGHTKSSVTGKVAFHSKGAAGVTLKCFHYTLNGSDGEWDSTPFLTKSTTGTGSYDTTFTYDVQRASVVQHYIRCGVTDNAEKTVSFNAKTKCAELTATDSPTPAPTAQFGTSAPTTSPTTVPAFEFFDNADLPFKMETDLDQDAKGTGIRTDCKCTCHKSLTCSYIHTKTYPKGMGLSKNDPSDRSKVTEAATKFFSHDGTNTKIHGSLCPKPQTGVFSKTPFHAGTKGDYKAGVHFVDQNKDTDHWSTADQEARDAKQTRKDRASTTPYNDPNNMGLYPAP